MALYTIPNSNPPQTIDSFTVVASANRIEPGGSVIISAFCTATGTGAGINFNGFNGSLTLSNFSRRAGFNNFGGLIVNTSQTVLSNGQRRFTASASIELTLNRDNSLVGRSFGISFSGPYTVRGSSETITVIAATVPETPNPPPPSNVCSTQSLGGELGSGSFIWFSTGTLVPYPRIDWWGNGRYTTDINRNSRDKEWRPV